MTIIFNYKISAENVFMHYGLSLSWKERTKFKQSSKFYNIQTYNDLYTKKVDFGDFITSQCIVLCT